MDSGQHKLNRNQFTLAHIFYIFRKEYELVKNFLKPKELRNRMKENGWFLSFSVFVLAHASVLFSCTHSWLISFPPLAE